MSKMSIKCLLYTIATMVAALPIVAAQTPSPNAGTPNVGMPVYRNRLPGISVTRMWDWTNETWDGKDQPYQQVRREIDQAVATHQDLNKLLAEYKTQARKQPDSSLALFHWAYMAYQVMLMQNSTLAKQKALDGVQEALYHTPSPHTYNYTRTQFLITEFYTPHHQTVAVAKRLLVVDGNDYQIEYGLASIYLNDYASPDFKTALEICNKLKKQHPMKPSVYALTGETYALWWYKDKNPAYARTALENYNKYLQVAPAKEEYRKQVKWIIGNLNSQLKSS